MTKQTYRRLVYGFPIVTGLVTVLIVFVLASTMYHDWDFGVLFWAALFGFFVSTLIYAPTVLVVDYVADRQYKREVDESWANDKERTVLAQTKRSMAKLTILRQKDLASSDTSNLLNNRTFLLELTNDYESRKRRFIKYFEPLDNRREHPQIYQNFAQILAEFDDAIAMLQQTLAEVEKKLRESENAPEIGEKRGTPEFQNPTQTYVPPNQPDWD